jgi:integrase
VHVATLEIIAQENSALREDARRSFMTLGRLRGWDSKGTRTREARVAVRLTDAIVKALPKPAAGNRMHYDTDVKGFGVCVTKAGTRAFVLTYRPCSGPSAGHLRRITIGAFPNWKTSAARDEARELKRRTRKDDDQLGAIAAEQDAPTVDALCDRFLAEHVVKKRPTTQVDYRSIISMYIRPELGNLKAAGVSFGDVYALHLKVTRHAPYRANRCVAVLSKMMALAIRWHWRSDNPCRGVELNQQVRRTRHFTAAELDCLTAALSAHPDRDATDAIRLLLLTRARPLEVLSMRWADLDITSGAWKKSASISRQILLHRAPLSTPALELLAGIRARSPADAVFVFPGHGAEGHRRRLEKVWHSVCGAAGIVGAQLHDLRHAFASILALGEPLIGALLGQPAQHHAGT